MLKTIKMAGLAAVVGFTGMIPITAPAFAQSSLQIIIGPDGARVRANDYCERYPGYDGCRDYRRGDRNGGGGRYDNDDDYGDGYGERRRPRGDSVRSYRTCSADEAVNKARRMGIRRARVVGVGERTIQVAGREDGRTVIVRFGRRGNCPILG